MSISEIKSGTGQVETDINLYASDIWRGFIKFWWVGVLCGVIFGAAVFAVSVAQFSPEYQVSATFTVHAENSTLTEEGSMAAYSFYYNQATVNNLDTVFPYVINSRMLKDRVCRDMGVESLPARVEVVCVDSTNIITITTTGKDPQKTYDVLESVVTNYTYITDYIIGPTKLVPISAPQLPTEPSNTLEWLADTLDGFLVGLTVGAAWIVLYAILRHTIRTKEDIHKDLNQNCLGVLPQVTFKKYREEIDMAIVLSNPRIGSDFPESVRLLRGVVQNSLQENEKVILVSSTGPGEGKSVTAVNLAAMFAQNNSKVLLIDGDLRNSGIRNMLFRNKNDAPEAANGDALYDIVHADKLAIDILMFRSAAKQLRKIVQGNKFRQIVESIRDQYDLILIDTPPCGIISDAAIIASAADVAMYVVRQDTIMASRVKEGLGMLDATDVRILGCVLNGALGGLGGYGHYYGYGGYNHYYRYGYSSQYGQQPQSTHQGKLFRRAKKP